MIYLNYLAYRDNIGTVFLFLDETFFVYVLYCQIFWPRYYLYFVLFMQSAYILAKSVCILARLPL